MLLQDWRPSAPEFTVGSDVVECIGRFTYRGYFISLDSLVADGYLGTDSGSSIDFCQLASLLVQAKYPPVN